MLGERGTLAQSQGDYCRTVLTLWTLNKSNFHPCCGNKPRIGPVCLRKRATDTIRGTSGRRGQLRLRSRALPGTPLKEMHKNAVEMQSSA